MMPKNVAIFTKPGCPYCVAALNLLKGHKINYEEVSLPADDRRYRILGALAKARTVPQVFIDGRYIGGSDDLERWATENLKN